MKKLSKLMAVLLALLMVVSSALADGEIVSIDSNAYQTATTAAEADPKAATNYGYELVLAYLKTKETAEERQSTMQNLNKYFSFIVDVEDFQNYYEETNPEGNLICTCAALDAYGNVTHDADCRWHFSALPAEDQQTVLADKLGGADVLAAWQSEQNVTEEMMLWAMQTGGIDTVVVADGGLYSVYTGGLLATLDEETNQLIDVRYHIAVAQFDPETGLISALN